MSSISDILVIGAGVLGLATAATLARRGRAVTVADPGGVNASRVAAGMIAPALEAAIEGMTPERAALLKAARDLWPGFADAAGIVLHRDGAEWRGLDAAAMVERMRALGFEAGIEDDGAVFTPDDWRITPDQALAAMAATEGVEVRRAAVTELVREGTGWRARLDDGGEHLAASVVLATGAAAPIAGLPDVARRLVDLIQPIRGQLDFVEGLACARVMRGEGAYVAPAVGGAVVGASMEPGRRDLAPDAEQGDRMLAAAGRFFDVDAAAVRRSFVGVRGASPDGLPMAGRTGDGLFFALAPRRNGWLLAPSVAQTVAAAIEDGPKTAFAAAFDPLRFA